jgi:hypothetical protein
MENRKQAISIRMNAPDVRNVKRLAKRLGVRDSDVIRYAVKVLLARLSPLHDPNARGRSLVPVFVETGGDLCRHFDLDAMRLESIINEGVSPDVRVAHEDIQLLAMSGVHRSYVRLRLASLNGQHQSFDQDNIEDSTDEELDESLRRYLYEKYMFRKHNVADSHPVLARTIEEQKL